MMYRRIVYERYHCIKFKNKIFQIILVYRCFIKWSEVEISDKYDKRLIFLYISLNNVMH